MRPDDNDRLRNGTLPADPGEGLVAIPPGTTGNRVEPPGNRVEPPANTRRIETLAEFRERAKSLPPPSWLMDGLVPDSGRLLIVAPPNVGKTWFALAIAKKADEQGRPSLLVLEEGGVRAMDSRFWDLAFPDMTHVHLMHLKGVKLGGKEDQAELVGFLKAHDAPLLVLDPLSEIFEGDENLAQDMSRATGHLNEFVRANPRALIVILHHTSKAGAQKEGPPKMHDARGSSALNGWADVQLHLSDFPDLKDPSTVAFDVTMTKARDGVKCPPRRVTLRLGSGEIIIGEPTSSKEGKLMQGVLAVLEKAEGPLSKNAILDAMGGNRKAVLTAVDDLEAAGRVTNTGRGYFLAPQ